MTSTSQVSSDGLRLSPIGRLVPITGHDGRFGEEYRTSAFLPDDLPVSIVLPSSVWLVVTDAMTELGRLDAAASLVPNPQLVARLATRREAIGTSALEGTFADLTDLFVAEILQDEAADVAPNVREVMNYTRAADEAYSWVKDRPITIGLLESLQAIIVRGTASDGTDTGSLRTNQVFIGAKHRRISEARFVPPPAGDQLRAMCERWIEWLTAPEPTAHIHLLARIALAHYQFETLHPFTDGNGRLGRLVTVLQMLREGVLRSPVLALSPWFEERGDDYRDHLLAVSRTGDWAPWIEFFANAVKSEARSGHDRIMRLLELKSEMLDMVRTAFPRGRLVLEVADELIAHPILSVADAHRRFGRSNQGNRDAIKALVGIGLLEPYGRTATTRCTGVGECLRLSSRDPQQVGRNRRAPATAPQ